MKITSALFVSVVFGADPLAKLKDSNPQAYALVKALMASSGAAGIVKELGSKDGKMSDPILGALKKGDKKSFMELRDVGILIFDSNERQ